MHKITKTITAIAASAALVTGVSACSSSGGGDSKPVATIASLSHGKSTSVALDSKFVAALGSLKVAPGKFGTASLTGTTVSFPITGGHVTVYKKGDVNPYVQGELDHNGSGITLTAGSTKVTLENFVINPGKNSELTGDVLVNGASAAKDVKLFDLDGSPLQPITIDSAGVAKLQGTRVLLSKEAAGLLNKTFKVNALKEGLLIGIATILAASK